jgi:hypothetical protein
MDMRQEMKNFAAKAPESPDAEAELIGRGETISKFLHFCGIVVLVLALIGFVMGVIAFGKESGEAPGLVQLAASICAGLLGFFLYAIGDWIKIYSWVIARASSATRKIANREE